MEGAWLNSPFQPADDGISAGELRLPASQSFDPMLEKAESSGCQVSRPLVPSRQLCSRNVAEWWNSLRLIGKRDVFAVEEGVGPFLYRIYFRHFRIPVPIPTHIDAHRPTDGEFFSTLPPGSLPPRLKDESKKV